MSRGGRGKKTQTKGGQEKWKGVLRAAPPGRRGTSNTNTDGKVTDESGSSHFFNGTSFSDSSAEPHHKNNYQRKKKNGLILSQVDTQTDLMVYLQHIGGGDNDEIAEA